MLGFLQLLHWWSVAYSGRITKNQGGSQEFSKFFSKKAINDSKKFVCIIISLHTVAENMATDRHAHKWTH